LQWGTVISILAPHVGNDGAVHVQEGRLVDISILTPARGATIYVKWNNITNIISILAPIRGATAAHVLGHVLPLFQSTPPCGGRPGERDIQKMEVNMISILAPRAGGDSSSASSPSGAPYFNPRPPCGGRLFQTTANALTTRFQSSPPVRGATKTRGRSGGRARISILAPRAGGDLGHAVQRIVREISILAPRAGGDRGPPHCPHCYSHFNPRPPCGGRPVQANVGDEEPIFQSSPPVRGATRPVDGGL